MLNRVLIADDHALVREGIGILIARGGFSVVAEASNGQEALTHASSHQPDMAVLDKPGFAAVVDKVKATLAA